MMVISGPHVRAARALLKLEQTELAQAAGVSTATLRKIENSDGEADVRLSTLRAIRNALEQAGIEFLDGDRPGVRMRAPTAV